MNLYVNHQNVYISRTTRCNSLFSWGLKCSLLLVIIALYGCDPLARPSHFENPDISFNYIKYYTEALDKPSVGNGIEVLLFRSSHYSPVFLQVVRTPNSATIQELYDQKKSATPIVLTGPDDSDEKVVKYVVTRIEVGSKAFVRVYVKKNNSDQAVSYQLLHKGFEYNLNFIYPKGMGLIGMCDNLDKDNNHDGEYALLTLQSLKLKN